MNSFTTKRLRLRPINHEDKELFMLLFSDDKVMLHIGHPGSQTQIKQLFENNLNNITNCNTKINIKRLTWAVIEKSDNLVIGIVALTWDLGKKDAASSGTMLHPNCHGKGFGLEAKGAVIEYAFSHLSLNSITSQFAVTNIASERINQKLGFIFDDTSEAGINTHNGLLAKSYTLKKQRWQQSFIENNSG